MLERERERERERVETDFTLENRLTCLNTKFQKRKRKLWTYTYANKTKAQRDYIFINKKWNNNALNCEAYSSFEGVSSVLRSDWLIVANDCPGKDTTEPTK